jgi:hypothetical protein
MKKNLRVLVLAVVFGIAFVLVELTYFSFSTEGKKTQLASVKVLCLDRNESTPEPNSEVNSTDVEEYSFLNQFQFQSQIDIIGKLDLSEIEMKRMVDALVARYQLDSLLEFQTASPSNVSFGKCDSTAKSLLSTRSILSLQGNLCSEGKNRFCEQWSKIECNPNQGVQFDSENGMGSTLNNYVNIAAVSLVNNRSVCWTESFVYGSLNMFFQSGRCGDQCSSKGTPRCDPVTIELPGPVKCRNNQGAWNFPDYLPAHLEGWTLDVKRELAESSLRMNKEITSIVDSQIQVTLHKAFDVQGVDCSQKSFTIGVHIRRGDKHREARMIEVETYMEAVRNITEVQNVSLQNVVVVIASDDFRVVEEFKNKTRGQMTVVSMEKLIDTSRAGFVEAESLVMEPHLKYISGLEMLIEVEALARANYVVCTHSSNVCRLIQMIRKVDEKSIVSVDGEWKAF